jgi:hypothetical protein
VRRARSLLKKERILRLSAAKLSKLVLPPRLLFLKTIFADGNEFSINDNAKIEKKNTESFNRFLKSLRRRRI